MAISQHSESLLDTRFLEHLKYARVSIVHTEWNDKIVRELVNGCESTIHKFGGDVLDKMAVPGCFELPFACRMLWEHHKNKEKEDRPEAIIAFGAVIRGGTPHFDYVCRAATMRSRPGSGLVARMVTKAKKPPSQH
jgi:6,7-dimethyl-8-ribityllumazine synthase